MMDKLIPTNKGKKRQKYENLFGNTPHMNSISNLKARRTWCQSLREKVFYQIFFLTQLEENETKNKKSYFPLLSVVN